MKAQELRQRLSNKLPILAGDNTILVQVYAEGTAAMCATSLSLAALSAGVHATVSAPYRSGHMWRVKLTVLG